MAARYTAIRWSREVPTLLHRGRVDRLGHHVLLLLATYSRNDGSDAFMSVTTLAKEAHAPERDVVDALGRLESAGLIERAHASNGAPGWSLNLSVRSDQDGVVADRIERRRVADRERQRRRRERLGASRHATVDRDVTPDSTVTDAGVTQELAVSHGEVDRDTADVTHKLGVSHASETVTLAGQTGCNSLKELHKDGTPRDELHADADASGANEPALIHIEPQPKPAKPKPAASRSHAYTAIFETAWIAYGKRGDKRDSFAEWQKAIKRADPSAIVAAIGPYVESTPDLQYRKHFQRWLKNDGWESVVVPARSDTNGHRPYQNPTDQSVYDAPL